MALRCSTPVSRPDRPRGTDRGSALVFVVAALLPLFALVFGFLTVSLQTSREHLAAVDRKKAFYMAEAGIAEAITALQQGGTGAVGSMTTPARMGDGVFWVEAIPTGSQLRLRSSGMQGRGRATLEVVVENVAAGFPYSVACAASLELDDGAMIDSFDSSLGTYADQLLPGNDHVNENAELTSNGYIKLKAVSNIYGDAHPGPGESVILSGGSVTGSTTPASTPFVLDPVTPPAIPPTGALELDSGDSLVLPAGNYSFTSVNLKSGATLTLEGPSTLVVSGQFDAAANSTMVFGNTGMPVEIYIGDTMSMGDTSTLITPGQDASLVKMYLTGTDQDATINSNGQFYGTIYGPDAYVELKASIELFGAVAADSLKMDAGAKVHYDEQLGQQGGGGSASYQMVSWDVVSFSQRSLMFSASDPFVALNLNKSSLPKPADAWQMP